VNATVLPGNLDDWLERIESQHPKSVDLGLERCGQVWRFLGSPQPAPRIFVVAGTNGKGSTVATLCSLLGALGHSHGSYTSPHIEKFNERVRINGEPVPDEPFLDAFERIEAVRGETSLTYFEFSTLAAFHILAGAGLDFAVMEVGLGGRLDAVNLLDADCAVITPIGLDHQDYLGEGLLEIGREKAGIIRPGRPVVCGEPNPPQSVIEAAAEQSAPLKRLGRDFSISAQDAACFTMGDQQIMLPLPALAGRHQLGNMATALTALLQLIPDAADESDALSRGLRGVSLHGRFERISQRPAIWVDVGHNPMAARVLAVSVGEAMDAEGLDQCRCVIAMLADKDAAAVAEELRSTMITWYAAGLEGDRGQTGAALAVRLAQAGGMADIREFRTVGQALDAAISDSGPDDGVLVFGSFLTAAEALRHG
jgi:dihydrofolate synthase/folylpolyglutamate synthase